MDRLSLIQEKIEFSPCKFDFPSESKLDTHSITGRWTGVVSSYDKKFNIKTRSHSSRDSECISILHKRKRKRNIDMRHFPYPSTQIKSRSKKPVASETSSFIWCSSEPQITENELLGRFSWMTCFDPFDNEKPRGQVADLALDQALDNSLEVTSMKEPEESPYNLEVTSELSENRIKKLRIIDPQDWEVGNCDVMEILVPQETNQNWTQEVSIPVD